MFKLVKVYSDQEGHSIPLREAGEIGYLSEKFPVKEVVFREVEPSYNYDFHTAPQRQFIVLLDGEIEIETSLGQKRKFSSGDVLLMEDIQGKGHRTRNITPHKRKSIFITLP